MHVHKSSYYNFNQNIFKKIMCRRRSWGGPCRHFYIYDPIRNAVRVSNESVLFAFRGANGLICDIHDNLR